MAGVRKDDRLYWQIDLRQDDVNSIPAAGLPPSTAWAFNAIRGRMSAQLEGDVVTQLTGVPTLSAAKLSQGAIKGKVPFRSVFRGNLADIGRKIRVSSAVRERMDAYTRAIGGAILTSARPAKIGGESLPFWWGLKPDGQIEGVRFDGTHGAYSTPLTGTSGHGARKGNENVLLFDSLLDLVENLGKGTVALADPKLTACSTMCDAHTDLGLLAARMCTDEPATIDLIPEVNACMTPQQSSGIMGVNDSCDVAARPARCGALTSTAILLGKYTPIYSEQPTENFLGPYRGGKAMLNRQTCGCR